MSLHVSKCNTCLIVPSESEHVLTCIDKSDYTGGGGNRHGKEEVAEGQPNRQARASLRERGDTGAATAARRADRPAAGGGSPARHRATPGAAAARGRGTARRSNGWTTSQEAEK